MGLRGPIPKPTALKRALGNPGKRELNEFEPVPPAPPDGVIDAPPWLTKRGLAIWKDLAPIVIAMGTLTMVDRYAFGRYCKAFARYLVLDEFLMEKGANGTTYPLMDKDKKIRHVQELPQAAEYRRLHDILIRLEDRFGLSASARSRIRVLPGGRPSVQAPDPGAPTHETFADFMDGGGPAPPRLVG